MPSESTAIHWYAIRIFHNKARAIKAQVDKDGLQSYVPMRTVEKFSNGNTSYINEPVIPSLIFIRADQGYIENIRKDPASYAGVYCYPGTSTPAVIPDRNGDVHFCYNSRKPESGGHRHLTGQRRPDTGYERDVQRSRRIYHPGSQCETIDRCHRRHCGRSDDLYPERLCGEDRRITILMFRQTIGFGKYNPPGYLLFKY